MGIWFRDPDITTDERVLFRATANRLVNITEMRGGRLVVTDRRVLFEPNRLDRITGGRSWGVDSHMIREVIPQQGGMEGIARFGLPGKRPHLVVTAEGMDPGVFAVRNMEALRTAVATSRGA
jgi:hypothetical protein